MILTKCAVCATELGLSLGKKCGRCSTRYCGAECQKQHWEGGGHDQLCKKIKRSGGAEQYNANNKYEEAVAVAAKACAEDTKGQTCYICTQALHWKTKEGLVRGCACRGTAGFAHVSCLAEQAKILLAEGEENNLSNKAMDERVKRWRACSLCEQHYHGVVSCALGWACWKTYVGRPEDDWVRMDAMTALGNGLFSAQHYEDALIVQEAELSMERRLGASEEVLLVAQGNLASTYCELGRFDEALSLRRDVYSGTLRLYGEEREDTLLEASHYADDLVNLQHFEEAKALLRKTIPVAQRLLREGNETTLRMRWVYAEALWNDDDATLDDLHEAATTLEEIERTARRVLGGAHPLTVDIGKSLRESREKAMARGMSTIREAIAAMTPSDAQDDPSS
jgi:tetratricopeptide (TPR) repeat protein